MGIQKAYILLRLQELEEANGGYVGTDTNNLAKELEVTYRALQKRLKEWLKTEPAFANFHYLGKHRPTITLNECAEMKERVSVNPLEVKRHICSDLNEKRAAIGKKSVAKTTFYRGIGQPHVLNSARIRHINGLSEQGSRYRQSSKKTFRHVSSSKYRQLSW